MSILFNRWIMKINIERTLLILTIIITFLFLILRYAEVIDWNWIWILSPLWVLLGIYLLFMMFLVIVAMCIKWD